MLFYFVFWGEGGMGWFALVIFSGSASLHFFPLLIRNPIDLFYLLKRLRRMRYPYTMYKFR